MKKSFIYIFIVQLVLVTSCQSKDDYKGEFEMTVQRPEFNTSTPAGLKASQMFDKYGVIFKSEFTEEEFSFDWSNIRTNYAPGTTGYHYTSANNDYAVEVMDSVDKWVFNIFGTSFISQNMPVNILLADTMCYRYTYSSKIVVRMLEGDIASNYTMLGYTSSRFTAAKKTRTLIESWVSLFIEKMVSAGNLSIPSAFSAVSATGYEQLSYTNSLDVVTTYAILKKGRQKQKTGSTTASWYNTTVAQDFGDFVAFIVYVPDSEKATYYTKNANVQTKVNIVKDYFSSKLGITLPYLPR
jgi:hypothetical protein